MVKYHKDDLTVEVINGVRRLWIGNTCQGQTSNTQPLSPVSNYLKSLVSEIGTPKSVLFIGLGAGILPAKYAKMGCDVVVVEPRKDVLDVAQKYFKFPLNKVTVFLGLGQDIVPNLGMFDIVVLDAHDGLVQPKEVYNEDFYQECLKHLNTGGKFLTNLIEEGVNKIVVKGNEVKG